MKSTSKDILISLDGGRFLEQFHVNVDELVTSNNWESKCCTICHSDFSKSDDIVGPNCPECNSRPRTRTLAILVELIESLNLELNKGELLAFAMTGLESRFVNPLFEKIESVSLYGEYSGGNHKSGVDVRDLREYPNGRFSGVFACLLFDYFTEHKIAISELHRVLIPGGILFTHIANKRLLRGSQEPQQVGEVRAGDRSFSYLGKNTIPSVLVGRDWFLEQLNSNGFSSCIIEINDTISKQQMIWYLAIKD